MADLIIERCAPSDRADGIRALFERAGQPGFSSVYERVYRVREPLGLRSWIGRIGDTVVLHISVSCQTFSDGKSTLTGALPADLMADGGHRDFWGPLKLVRRMVADVRSDRTAAFLLTSFAPSAEAVFRAAGFKQFIAARRYVLPLSWPYPVLRRLAHGERRPALTAVPFADGTEVPFTGVDSPGAFRPVPSSDYFSTRMPREQYPLGTWLLAGHLHAPDAVVLVSPQPGRQLAIADVLWRRDAYPLAGLFSAVAKWAARNGHRRLSVSTVPGSRLAQAAQRAGFLRRPDAHSMMLLPVHPHETIPSPEHWSITPFVLTAW